jgi:hypothetical protein
VNSSVNQFFSQLDQQGTIRFVAPLDRSPSLHETWRFLLEKGLTHDSFRLRIRSVRSEFSRPHAARIACDTPSQARVTALQQQTKQDQHDGRLLSQGQQTNLVVATSLAIGTRTNQQSNRTQNFQLLIKDEQMANVAQDSTFPRSQRVSLVPTPTFSQENSLMAATPFTIHYSKKTVSLGKRITQTLATALAVITLMTLGAVQSRAVDFDLTIANQNWNTGTNWTPNGVPTSGNSVIIDQNVTVTSSASFGSNSSNSFWSGPNPVITINPGQSLTHVAGSTLVVNASQPYFSNTGTFENYGSIINSTRFLLGYPTPGSVMNNYGSFEFTAAGARLETYSNGSNFYNQAGGSVIVNLPNATDKAFVLSDNAASNAKYIQAGGNPMTFTQGRMVFAPPGGVGAALDDTLFAQLFGPINANSELRLSGGINSIVLTNPLTDLSRVRLGNDDAGAGVLRTQPGGTSINVTVPGGLKFADGAVYVELTPGETMTNVAGSKLIAPSGQQIYFANSGTFHNAGTIEVQNNRFLFGYPSGGTNFNNAGLLEFTANGGHMEFWGFNTTFRSLPGGKLRVNMPNASDVARMNYGNVDNNGQYLNMGGDPIEFVKGTFVFAPSGGIGGTLDDAAFAGLFGPINANSSLRIGGSYPSISLTNPLTDLSRVSLGHSLMDSTLRVGTSGTMTINVTVPGGLKFSSGTPFIDLGTGRTLINVAGSHLVAPAGSEVYFSGTGTFRNEGLVTIENNRFLFGYSTPGAQFVNKGITEFTQNGARVELYQPNAGMLNDTDGKLTINLPNSTDLARVYAGAGLPVIFQNKGTIEVTKGIFRVESTVTVPSWTSTALNEGTYRVLANGNNSTLDLLASGTSAGSITTIGANAKVILSSTGGNVATFSQLGSISTLQGELFVHGTKNLAVGASPLTVTGVMGGDGTFTSANTITFNGGELDPSSLSGGPGTLTINGSLSLSNTTLLSFSLDTPNIVGGGINDLVVVNGDLTLDGILDVTQLPNFGVGDYRLFNYTGTLFNNGLTLNSPYYVLDLSTIGQVNLSVLPVPEPSTGLLLLAGIVGLRRRKRS